MTKNIRKIMAVAMLGIVALTGLQAQTTTGTAAPPNPNAGTFADDTLSLPQRIDAALALIDSGTADAAAVGNAANFALQRRPVIPLLTARPTFASSAIADPTLGGKTENTGIWKSAVEWQADSLAAVDEKIAFIESKLAHPPAGAETSQLKYRLGNLNGGKANTLCNQGQYAAALDLAYANLGNNPAAVLDVILRAKTATRAGDTLEWAKLHYLTRSFAQTQAGVTAVSSALRLRDANLVAANRFVEFQKTGEGENPLAGVSLPPTLPDAPFFEPAVNPLAALKEAHVAFATANPANENALNAAASRVAAALRNLDGNTVRANAFVNALSENEPFEIAELK